jgi:glycosyltransferase involved in cell wall biosynthesis
MSVRVSVVVPTYRRADLLDRCLSALAAQDCDGCDYEIIVADDAASDETRRQVEKWARSARCAVRYVAVNGRHGPAAARNAGWRTALGEDIAFTDDDCVPDRQWVRAGAAVLSTECSAPAAAWGRLRMPLPTQPTDYERNEARLEYAEFVTANCFVRRDVLQAVGGFDERFTAAWREDADLYFTLLERGYRVIHAPEALVVHPVRSASWGVSLRQQRKNAFNALLYKKHPELYRQKIQGRPPWHYYASTATLGFAVGAGLEGATWPMAVGLLAWLALTARFAALRLRGTSHQPEHIAEMLVTSALIPPLSIFWRLRGAVRFGTFFL